MKYLSRAVLALALFILLAPRTAISWTTNDAGAIVNALQAIEGELRGIKDEIRRLREARR